MATSTYYAWSTFPGKAVPGDKVDAKSLDVSDEDFDAFIRGGSVRSYKFPDMGDYTGSPKEFAREQLLAQGDDADFARLENYEEPEPSAGPVVDQSKPE